MMHMIVRLILSDFYASSFQATYVGAGVVSLVVIRDDSQIDVAALGVQDRVCDLIVGDCKDTNISRLPASVQQADDFLSAIFAWTEKGLR